MWSINWKIVLLLSIVIPICLVTSFKLSGILHEPMAIAETAVLDVTKGEFERPYGSTLMNETMRVLALKNKFQQTSQSFLPILRMQHHLMVVQIS